VPTINKVILTRETPDNQRIAAHLPPDLRVVDYPCVETHLLPPTSKDLAVWLDPIPAAVAVTSRRAVEALAGHGATLRHRDPPVGAIGAATSRAVEVHWGLTPTWLPPEPTGRSLGRVLADALQPGSRVLYLRGNLSTGELAEALGSAGLLIEEHVVYENTSPKPPPLHLTGLAVAAFASPSAVVRFLTTNPDIAPRIVAVAAGPTTAEALRNSRFPMVREATGPGPAEMAQCILDVTGGRDES